MFWNEPTSLFARCISSRLLPALNGKLITEVENIPPQVTALTIDDTDLTEFQALKPVEIKGHIIGQFLNGTKLDLVTSIPGLTVSLVGSPTQQRLDFILKVEKPISPGTVLDFRVAKDQGTQIASYIVNYTPKTPIINTQTLPTIPQGTTEKTITITGSNFIKGYTSVVITPSDGK